MEMRTSFPNELSSPLMSSGRIALRLVRAAES
jgi:hypothetical protein